MSHNPYESPQEARSCWPVGMQGPRDYFPWLFVVLFLLALAIVVIDLIGTANTTKDTTMPAISPQPTTP